MAKAADQATGYDNLEFVYMLAGRTKEGIENYTKAVEHLRLAADLTLMHVPTRNSLGIALAMLGRHFETREAFNAVLNIRPDFVSTINNLGNEYFQSGASANAWFHYRNAIELDPEDMLLFG